SMGIKYAMLVTMRDGGPNPWNRMRRNAMRTKALNTITTIALARFGAGLVAGERQVVEGGLGSAWISVIWANSTFSACARPSRGTGTDWPNTYAVSRAWRESARDRCHWMTMTFVIGKRTAGGGDHGTGRAFIRPESNPGC